MKAFYTFLSCFFIYVVAVQAQRDTEFWFVAPEVSQSILDYDRPVFLKIFSYEDSATVTVSMPANPGFPTQIITMVPQQAFELNVTPYIDQIENKPENTVLNRGIKIVSNKPVSVYYEILGDCACNPELLSLKGRNALGKDFYVPFQTFLKNGNSTDPASSTFDIVATANGTSVTITPTKNLVGHPAGTPFTISLNRGQTYSLKAASDLASQHATGTHVSSNRVIAITMKDDLLNGGLVYGNYCLNIVADQIVPVKSLGKKYVVNKGNLWSTEKAFVVATVDGTKVKVFGLPNTTLDQGESMTIDINGVHYIKGSKPLYVLQMTGTGCETSGDIVPSLDKTGSWSAGFIRSTPEPFFLSLTTEQGNQAGFELNGNNIAIDPLSFNDVPGTQGLYVSAVIELPETVLPAEEAAWVTNSLGVFQAGILNGAEYVTGSRFALLADFLSNAPQPSLLKVAVAAVKVFPNPSADRITVEVDLSNYTDPKVVIKDLTGRTVKEMKLKDYQTEVVLTGFAEGIYIYSILDGSAIKYSGKLVKTN